MIENYIAIGALNVLVLLILNYMIYNNYALENKVKQLYILTDCLTGLVIVCEVVTIVAESLGPDFYTLHLLANTIGFAITPFIPILLALVFSPKYFEPHKKVLLPCIINLIFVITSYKTGFIFSISPENTYSRGAFYWIFIVSYLWAGAVFIKTIIISTKYYYTSSRLLMPFLCLFILLATTTQIMFPMLHTAWISVTFALVVYYGFTCEYYNQHDIVTSLFNRVAYENAKRQFQTLEAATIIVIDVAKFKQINDTYGHQYGDYCLSRIGMAIKDSFSDIGVAFRIGGDEFCILSEVTEEKRIKDTIKNLTKIIDGHKKKKTQFPSIDIGYKIYHKSNGYTLEDAFKDADSNVYEHKKNRQ